jgi:Icc-related predicted phosphoesterase
MKRMTVHILILADIHGNIKIIKKIRDLTKNKQFNALFIAGDLSKNPCELFHHPFQEKFQTNNASLDITKVIEYQESSLRAILDEILDLDLPTYIIPGNEDNLVVYEKVINNRYYKYSSIVNVNKRACNFDEYVIIGLGGCNYTPTAKTFYEWEEEEAKYELERLFKEYRNCNVILLTHSPPLGSNLDVVKNQLHLGSFAIRSIINKYQPIICVCGHVHEAPGVERIGNTVVINPGSLEIPNSLGNSNQPTECLVAEVSLNEKKVRCKIYVINIATAILLDKIYEWKPR